MILAHISDLHIGQDHGDGGARAQRRTERVLGFLNGLAGDVDAILVTGDLTEHGRPEEYRAAAELLAGSRFPVLTCPGNHDNRAAYQQEFLEEESGDGTQPVNRCHQLPGATVAMCDSTIPGRDDGLLDDTTLVWLDKILSDAPRDEPALVCFHHPPVELHIPFVDGIRQRGEERLAEVLRGHENVVAVLCGHAHTAATSTFAGRPLVVAPGVVSTVVLPFESSTTIDYQLRPAVAFHLLDDDRRLITHFRSL